MSPDMNSITHRIEILTDTLRTFIAAYEAVCGEESRTAAKARINDLCQVIVKLGGTVTQEIP